MSIDKTMSADDLKILNQIKSDITELKSQIATVEQNQIGSRISDLDDRIAKVEKQDQEQVTKREEFKFEFNKLEATHKTGRHFITIAAIALFLWLYRSEMSSDQVRINRFVDNIAALVGEPQNEARQKNLVQLGQCIAALQKAMPADPAPSQSSTGKKPANAASNTKKGAASAAGAAASGTESPTLMTLAQRDELKRACQDLIPN